MKFRFKIFVLAIACAFLFKPADVFANVETDLPKILGASDLELYSKIFVVQEAGQWKKADALINKLDDRVLLGHVLAQRYLHPTKYRSRYKELRRWLNKYHDHPQADRIYKLSTKRKPSNALNAKKPTGKSLKGSGFDGTGFASRVYAPKKNLNRTEKKKAKNYQRKMRHYSRNGWTKSLKRLLNTKEVHALLHRGEIDRARAMLAAGYYAAGRDQWAHDWAVKSINRSGLRIPVAYWVAGLASWRMNDLDEAHQYFEKVTQSKYASDWLISASAYWAARAELILGKPQEVNTHLKMAALYPRTFYGQLATRALGYTAVFDWSIPQIDPQDLSELKLASSAKRALALLQVGDSEMAEKELRKAYHKVGTGGRHAMLGVAMRSNMPSFSMRLADNMRKDGQKVPDAALYPMPDWKPKRGGFTVDRALVFAVMRQESGFNPNAKSHAGARGLMQLMPATASFVARDRRMKNSKEIYDPETNIYLGQNYINMLLSENAIKGDLFHLMAAWNGGPGNLNKWKKNIKHNNDPLLFIESIPARETRNFIERVLTNLWVYRDRMGQDVPSLDRIASGQWPQYRNLDEFRLEMVTREETDQKGSKNVPN